MLDLLSATRLPDVPPHDVGFSSFIDGARADAFDRRGKSFSRRAARACSPIAGARLASSEVAGRAYQPRTHIAMKARDVDAVTAMRPPAPAASLAGRSTRSR